MIELDIVFFIVCAWYLCCSRVLLLSFLRVILLYMLSIGDLPTECLDDHGEAGEIIMWLSASLEFVKNIYWQG